MPLKYYAIAIPLWLAVTMFFSLFLYVGVCMIFTPDIESFETLQDRFSILKNPKVYNLNENLEQKKAQQLD